MNIINAITKVDLRYYNQRWNVWLYVNEAEYHFLRSNRVWSKKDGMYYTIKDGLVSFLCNPNSGGGLGATMDMDDGSRVRISGCWSSNPRHFHEVTNILSHDVMVNNGAAHITHEAFLMLAKRFNLTVIPPADGEFYWHVTPPEEIPVDALVAESAITFY